MPSRAGVAARSVAKYASLLHADIGVGHHAASPLGAWLLLALAAPAVDGADRESLTEVLGCDIETAADAAAELIKHPHPLVPNAAAVWTAAAAPLAEPFEKWRASLPSQVDTGALPDQAGLDRWAHDHTFGLIDSFPVRWDESLYVVLATALATKVSWRTPFDLAPATSLGSASPWAEQVTLVLRTPEHDDRKRDHDQFICGTPEAGDVAVHIAAAVDGLLVISVAAQPDIPARDVMAIAHRIGMAVALGAKVPRRNLADLPLGENGLWLLREETSTESDACIALLPAWSAQSLHDLRDPALGFGIIVRALTHGRDPWDAQQAVQARYSRTGFEAAAVTAAAVYLSARLGTRRRRVAELRFGHPYAVVAITVDEVASSQAGQQGLWNAMPVFSAWVAAPEEPDDDRSPQT
jgi:hypothetical protein